MQSKNQLFYTSFFISLATIATLMAQDKTEKLKERFKAEETIGILMDSQNVDIVFEDWNKDEVEIEAYLETEGLDKQQIEQYKSAWQLQVQGNSKAVRVNSLGGNPRLNPGNNPSGGSLDELMAASMTMMEPMMKDMLENINGSNLPAEYFQNASNVKFDYEAYRKGGEDYLKEYKKKTASSLGADYDKVMAQWAQQLEQQMQQMAKDQKGSFKKTVTRDAQGNIIGTQLSVSKNLPLMGNPSSTVVRKMIVRMPKAARLDLNVRHGDIKIGTAQNAKINLAHGAFLAKTIDGLQTYVTIAYSPIEINSWNYGTLRTSYVKSCVINTAARINLDTRASNIVINEIEDAAIIRGSFGELTIPKVDKNFKGLSISLENSDLKLTLPETAYTFNYNGTRSNLQYPKKIDAKVMQGYDSKMLNGFYRSRETDSNITISSKFSNVVVN